MPDRPGIATTSAPCEAHQRHAPAPIYCEEHHIVPQSWQQLFTPAVAPFPGAGTLNRPLWDVRIVPLCRTGHGNVHWWLVAAMHALAKQGGDGSRAALDAAFAAATKGVKGKVFSEIAIARQAMERFVAAGGDLKILTAAGEWGYI